VPLPPWPKFPRPSATRPRLLPINAVRRPNLDLLRLTKHGLRNPVAPPRQHPLRNRTPRAASTSPTSHPFSELLERWPRRQFLPGGVTRRGVHRRKGKTGVTLCFHSRAVLSADAGGRS